MNQLTQTASSIASEISSIESREQGRSADAQKHRAVECPSDIIDEIGGWKTSGLGHGYGKGYPLEVLENWMKRI